MLAQKRRVYLSQIAITSQTAQTSNQTSAPFQFTADPRTLVRQRLVFWIVSVLLLGLLAVPWLAPLFY